MSAQENISVFLSSDHNILFRSKSGRLAKQEMLCNFHNITRLVLTTVEAQDQFSRDVIIFKCKINHSEVLVSSDGSLIT